MKFLLAFTLCLLSTSAFSYDSNTCPVKFTLTYSNVKRLPLTDEIQYDLNAFNAWTGLVDLKNVKESFVLNTRPDHTPICVYVNDHAMAYLVPAEGVIELMVSLKKMSKIAFVVRTKILNFTPGKIEISHDEENRTFYSQVYSTEPGSTDIVGQINLATAQSVDIQLN